MGKGGSNTHLRRSRLHGIPIESREDVLEEDGIVFDFLLLELGVAEMKGEGERGCFAASNGAGEEIDGEQFHCLGLMLEV